MIHFEPFWKMMEEREISQYHLVRYCRLSSSQLQRLRHNQSVTTDTISRICELFDCEVSDVMYYSKQPEKRPRYESQ